MPYSEEILLSITVRLREAVQSTSKGSKQVSEALSLGGVTGVFEIDINTVKAIVLDELNSAVNEGGPLASVGNKVKVTRLRVCPTTDGESDLEIAVLQFKEVKLLQATVEVVPCVIPGVTGEVFLRCTSGGRTPQGEK